MATASLIFGVVLSVAFGIFLQLVVGSFFSDDFIIRKPTDSVSLQKAKAVLMMAGASILSYFAIVQPLDLA